MADITRPEKRAAAFGMIGAGFGAGFVLGPVAGGFLAEFGTRAPFWAAAVLAAGNVIFGWIVLRETVNTRSAAPLSWRRANPLGALRALGDLPGVSRLLLVYFLYHLAFAVYPSVWSYFGKAQFGWSPAMIGGSLALFGAAMAVVQGGLIRPVLHRFAERGTVLIGFACSITTFGLIATVTWGSAILILTPLAALAGVIPPALQALMSARVTPERQGALQGLLTSASALAMVVAPLVMTSVFAAFTSASTPVYFAGAPFVLSMILSVVALVLFRRVRINPAHVD
jgi:DHA1 family tetracycline resistance protein-like MFS transporter